MKIVAAFSGFSTNDLEETRNFYSQKLGLEVTEMPGMGLHIILPGGGKVFAYLKPDHQPASYTMLNLVVDDIDAAVDAFTQNGVTFERYDNMPAAQDAKGILRGRQANMGPDIAWFKDPAGNIVAVMQDE